MCDTNPIETDDGSKLDKFLLLDVYCPSNTDGRDSTLLLCSTGTIECKFSFHNALFIFDNSITYDDVLKMIFGGSLSDSKLESTRNSVDNGTFFKVDTSVRSNTYNINNRLHTPTYVKYRFTRDVENSFGIPIEDPNIVTSQDIPSKRLFSTLLVISTNIRYIRGMISKISSRITSCIFPYITPREAFVFEYNLHFPCVFGITNHPNSLNSNSGNIIEPSRNLFFKVSPDDYTSYNTTISSSSNGITKKFDTSNEPLINSDKVIISDILLGCNIEVCPIYNQDSKELEIAFIRCVFIPFDSSGQIITPNSTIVEYTYDQITRLTRDSIMNEIYSSRVFISVTLYRDIPGLLPSNSFNPVFEDDDDKEFYNSDNDSNHHNSDYSFKDEEYVLLKFIECIAYTNPDIFIGYKFSSRTIDFIYSRCLYNNILHNKCMYLLGITRLCTCLHCTTISVNSHIIIKHTSDNECSRINKRDDTSPSYNNSNTTIYDEDIFMMEGVSEERIHFKDSYCTCEYGTISNSRGRKSSSDFVAILTTGRIIIDLYQCLIDSGTSIANNIKSETLIIKDSKSCKLVSFSIETFTNEPNCDFWDTSTTNYRFFCSFKQFSRLVTLQNHLLVSSIKLLDDSKHLQIKFELCKLMNSPINLALQSSRLKMSEWWLCKLLYDNSHIIIPPPKHLIINGSCITIPKRLSSSDYPNKKTSVNSDDNFRLSTCDISSNNDNTIRDNIPNSPNTVNNNDNTSYEGGYKYVNALYNGLSIGNFVEIDLSSYYPAVVIQFSVDISSKYPILTLLMKSIVANRRIHASKRKVSTDPHGIAELALKLGANSVYGCMGSNMYRFYSKTVASSICKLAREFIISCCNTIKNYPISESSSSKNHQLRHKKKLSVVYVDTDGIILHLPHNYPNSSVEDLIHLLVKDHENLSFKIEGYYSKIFIRNKGNLILYKKLLNDSTSNTTTTTTTTTTTITTISALNESLYTLKYPYLFDNCIVKGLFQNRSTSAAVRICSSKLMIFILENYCHIHSNQNDDNKLSSRSLPNRKTLCNCNTNRSAIRQMFAHEPSNFYANLAEFIVTLKHEFYNYNTNYFAKWNRISPQSTKNSFVSNHSSLSNNREGYIHNNYSKSTSSLGKRNTVSSCIDNYNHYSSSSKHDAKKILLNSMHSKPINRSVISDKSTLKDTIKSHNDMYSNYPLGPGDYIPSVLCTDGIYRPLKQVLLFPLVYKVNIDDYWFSQYKSSLMNLLCGNLKPLFTHISSLKVFDVRDCN